MIPIGPSDVHVGFEATFGVAGNDRLICCARIEFGLRSYCDAGSLLEIGNTPVVASVGRSSLVMTRFEPCRVTDIVALGHDTLPSTTGFFVRSNVPPPLNHGPLDWAPPVDGNDV